jgi:hypothetical protein
LVSPLSVNFGNVLIHKTSAQQIVTFNNNSGATVTFSSVALTTGTDFSINSNTCSGTLTTGNNCTVGIIMTPTSTGTKTDTLTFTFTGTPGSPITVSISGSGKKHGVLKVGAVVKWRVSDSEERAAKI